MIRFSADTLARTTTLRQLQILVAVARHGGYTRAAKALHLTQPTVSMQIKKLSENIGLPLFEQRGKKLQLTSAGKKTLEASRDILNRLDLLGGEISSLTGEMKGELRIAVVTTAKYFMPHLLGVFIQRYPDVQPRLFVTNRERVLQRLQENEDDLLIMGRVPKELEVEAIPFLDNDLVVIAPPRHRLTKKRAIPLEQLLEERFLLREPGSGTRLATDKLFSSQGLVLEPYMELGSIEAIKQAVMAGLGISVMSRHNLRLELDGGKMCMLNVKDFPLHRHWFAVHASDRNLNLVSQTFLNFIRDEGSMILHE
ncbi:LysR family transcriptional regulator [Thiolapillus sp.]